MYAILLNNNNLILCDLISIVKGKLPANDQHNIGFWRSDKYNKILFENLGSSYGYFNNDDFNFYFFTYNDTYLQSGYYNKTNFDYSQISNIETSSPFEKELRKEGDKQQELKIITSIQHLFEKFDAGGETLLSLYKTNDNRKNILNNFFVNLLAWGSYRVGGKYATDLLVAYNAIVKKFPYVNKRIEKILNNPEKYVISDGILTSSLKTVLECLTKIQKFYEDNFLSKKNKNIEIVIDDQDNDDDDIDKDKNATNMGLNLPETSINDLIKEDNEKKNIIDLINEINIGNLFILKCGNEGLYSSEEIQMLFMFLINSNFINHLN
jgi:hypothetical protein